MSYPYYGTLPPKKRNSDLGGSKENTFFVSPVMVGLIFISLVVGGIWMNRNVHSLMNVYQTSTKASLTAAPSAATTKIDFTLVRSMYDPVPYFNDKYTSYLNYAFLKPYDAIVEPYQTMDLYFYESGVTGKFTFQVCPEGQPESCQEGFYFVSSDGKSVTKKGVEFSCSPHSTFDLTLTTVGDNDQVLATQAGKGLCLYVRRELRQLKSEDLTAYMDATYTLYSTPDEDGQKLYGPEFQNSTLLVKIHHFNSAQLESDHIHEGNGFLMQHVKLTNMFDEAVRVIDPSQSLPYWDFTIDSTEGRMTWESIILTPEMYGEMRLPANVSRGYEYGVDTIDAGHIVNGRWKDLKADVNWYYPELNYGYGYLRGAWNMNPSPYVSRFGFHFYEALTIPSCENHYDALQFDDLMDFFYWNSYSPHSKLHTTIGGFFGCNKFYPLVDAGFIVGETAARKMCAFWSFKQKEMWRHNYITANTQCTPSQPMEASYCGFQCVEDKKDEMIAWLFEQQSEEIDMTDYEAAANAFKEFICGGEMGYIFTGDHLESASPGDPSFWVIHPTLERLLHAKLMTGGFDSESWSTDVVNDFVCTKPSCYHATENRIDYFDDCCYGHMASDQMLDAVSGDASLKVGLTNAEVLSRTDPRSMSYAMDYVYDQFSWGHCLDDGYDFMVLLDDMHKDYFDTVHDAGEQNSEDSSVEKTAVDTNTVENNNNNNNEKKKESSSAVKKQKRTMTGEQKMIKERKAMFRNMGKKMLEWQEKRTSTQKTAKQPSSVEPSKF